MRRIGQAQVRLRKDGPLHSAELVATDTPGRFLLIRSYDRQGRYIGLAQDKHPQDLIATIALTEGEPFQP